MSTDSRPGFHNVRLLCSCLLLVVLIVSASSAYARQAQPEDVIAAEVDAQNAAQWEHLPEHWVTNEQPALRDFFANESDRLTGRGYFAIQSARLVGLKELAASSVAPFVDIDGYQSRYGTVRIFYAAIDYTVTHEDKFFYNGTNYRLLVIVREQHLWRLAEMSEAPVEAIVGSGNGFGTTTERGAITVREARRKGDIINPAGTVLSGNAADVAEERRRRGHAPVPPDATQATASTPVPPSIIYVRMTRDANKVWYSCPTGCTVAMTFTTTYVKNVLPNEWSDANFPVDALKAGAMAVKHYGWYRVLNPKYPGLGYDVVDTTDDQVYIAGTAKTWASAAVDAVAGIGMKRTTSQDIFQAQYVKGTCICNGGQSGGKVLQLGSWYQASTAGKTYTQILRYYYDNASINLGGQTISIFYH